MCLMVDVGSRRALQAQFTIPLTLPASVTGPSMVTCEAGMTTCTAILTGASLDTAGSNLQFGVAAGGDLAYAGFSFAGAGPVVVSVRDKGAFARSNCFSFRCLCLNRVRFVGAVLAACAYRRGHNRAERRRCHAPCVRSAERRHSRGLLHGHAEPDPDGGGHCAADGACRAHCVGSELCGRQAHLEHRADRGGLNALRPLPSHFAFIEDAELRAVDCTRGARRSRSW